MLQAFATTVTGALTRLRGALWKQFLFYGMLWLGFSSGNANGDTGRKCVVVRPARSAHASSLRVAAARRGKAVAVWCEGAYGCRTLTLMSYHPRCGWGRDRPGTSGAGDDGEAKTAVNSSGFSMVVWIRSGNGSREILAAGYHPRSGWQAPAVLDASGRGMSPDVTVDDGGNAIAVWNREEPGGEGYSVVAARYTALGWEAPVTLHRGATSPASSLSGNAAGEAMVVWSRAERQQLQRRHNTFAARFHPATGWDRVVALGEAIVEPEETPEDGTTSLPGAYHPAVAVDAAGNAVALWQEVAHVQGASRLMANRFEVGKGWGRAQLLAEGALDHSLTAGEEGRAYVCWTQSVSVSYVTSYVSSLCVASYVPGAGWRTEKVLGGHPYLCSDPRVTAGKKGGLLVTWLNTDGSGAQLWSVRSTPSTGWGEPLYLKDVAGITEYDVTAGDAGTMTVAWAEGGGDAGEPAVKLLQMEL